MPVVYILLAGIGGLAIGVTFGYLFKTFVANNKIDSAENRADQIVRSAKDKEQELLLRAKEQSFSILEGAKKEEDERRKEIQAAKQRLEERENKFDAKLTELQEKSDKIEKDKAFIEQTRTELEGAIKQAKERLTELADMDEEQAREELFSIIERDHKEALSERLRKMDKMTEEEIEAKARRILSLAIARYAGSHVADVTTTLVELPSDDMKGRIIGKEGRNIRRIEHLTGCELIVDDTPKAVTISGFSPVRRQVAKRALEILIKDGRIQPARIEEAIEQSKKDLAKEMRKAGEEALYELGIPVQSIDPKLVSILGRLKFRTSYGQNVLKHSIEVARISAMLAEELGADVFNCKKGGLFHDIGKAVDHDMQGAHPQIGYNIMKKFGFSEDLCYQSIAHHEDKPRTLEGVIVKAADAISGARPGARRNSIEDYLQRLQNLESTATEFEGVEKAFAIQAGREVRVFVEPTQVDDLSAYRLAKDIAKKIEHDLTYPGEVKVTIVRETRVTEYAR